MFYCDTKHSHILRGSSNVEHLGTPGQVCIFSFSDQIFLRDASKCLMHKDFRLEPGKSRRVGGEGCELDAVFN